MDLKEVSVSLLSTTGKRCILDHAVVICGTLASPTAAITFGQVGALTDFVGAAGNQTLTNLATQYDAVIIMPVPHATVPVKTKSYAAATVIQMNVATADADGSTNAIVKLYGTLY
jgi:hypothetical protein